MSFITAGSPQQVIQRYKKVLRHFQKGKSFSECYIAVGFDRNTITTNAAVAELAIAAPDKFDLLLKGYSRVDQLKSFVRQCSQAINDDPLVMAEIEKLKAEGKLLPFLKRK